MKEQVNEELRILWKNTLERNEWPNSSLNGITIEKYWPVQYGTLKRRGTVFIGLNPAAPPEAWRSKLRLDGLWAQRLDDVDLGRKVVQERDEAMGRGFGNGSCNSYFQRLEAFQLEDRWEHIDLFAIRSTNSALVQKALFPRNELTAFAMRQACLAMNLLIHVKPKAIVVLDAKASRLLQTVIFKQTNLQLSGFDLKRGHHWLTISGREIPVLFAGNLNFMDKGSKERLYWLTRRCMASYSQDGGEC